MSLDNDKSNKKWGIIKEQLISLCALNALPKGNDDFAKLLREDIPLKSINSQILTSISYFLLGIINLEERDKLIKWPLVNIQTQTKFRKGVSAMISIFQEKYPWANVKKLPESYFLNPHGYHGRIIDFISRLTNLAIHIALNDPELLFMHSGAGVNSREIAIMTEVVGKARQNEEILIRNNVFPAKDFEEAKTEICDKCIVLKQVNDELQQELNSLIKHAVSEGIAPAGDKAEIEAIMKLKDQKLSEVNAINEGLLKYFNASKELLGKIKALKNPMSLSAKDFGCENTPPDLIKATNRVCADLCEFFQFIISRNSSIEEEESFYKQLKSAKLALVEEKKALESFLDKISVSGNEEN